MWNIFYTIGAKQSERKMKSRNFTCQWVSHDLRIFSDQIPAEEVIASTSCDAKGVFGIREYWKEYYETSSHRK